MIKHTVPLLIENLDIIEDPNIILIMPRDIVHCYMTGENPVSWLA